jgi:hypothetical protein
MKRDKNDREQALVKLDTELHSSLKIKLIKMNLTKQVFFNLASHLLVSGSLEKMILEKNAEVNNDN